MDRNNLIGQVQNLGADRLQELTGYEDQSQLSTVKQGFISWLREQSSNFDSVDQAWQQYSSQLQSQATAHKQ